MPKIRIEFKVPDNCNYCGFFDDECAWCKILDTAVVYNKNKNLYERCDRIAAEIERDLKCGNVYYTF